MPILHHTEAHVTPAVWDDCYFALLSLKVHLQSLPGWQEMTISASQEADHIAVLIETTWEHRTALGVWLERGITPESLIRSIAPEAAHLESRLTVEL